MAKQREQIGFADELENLSASDFKPKQGEGTTLSHISKEEIAEVSEKAGFPSREPKTRKRKEKVTRKRRTYRTGRSDQFNNRCDPKVIQGYYDIAEAMNIPTMGETLERALRALEREHEAHSSTPNEERVGE